MGEIVNQPRLLPNAPIVEAVIDLRVRFDREVTISDIEAVAALLGEGYSQKGFSFNSRVAFSVNQDAAITLQPTKSERLGVRLNSADDKYVAIIAIGGFTLARLAPYQDWSALRDEAMRLWQIYCEALRPAQVSRTATRYVNNLRLPLNDGESFEKYIKKFVEIPESLPQAVAEYVARYVLVDVNTNNQAIVALSYQPPTNQETISVVLDIDAFSMQKIGTGIPDITEKLAGLRDLKNRCFFGTLTDEALKLYQ